MQRKLKNAVQENVPSISPHLYSSVFTTRSAVDKSLVLDYGHVRTSRSSFSCARGLVVKYLKKWILIGSWIKVVGTPAVLEGVDMDISWNTRSIDSLIVENIYASHVPDTSPRVP